MKKHKIITALTLFAIVLFVGCAVQPQLTPEQKRQITTRVFESEYENTYRSILVVLQDRQFIVKNTDMNTGLINASIDVATSASSQALQAALVGRVTQGQKEEVSFMVSKISNEKTEVRLNIQIATYGKSSARATSEQQTSRQILEPGVYNRLFDEIRAEVERRKSLNN